MIRQNRLLGYTWNPEQKKDYEDLYQSWSASDMAAEIVNLNILQSLALSREAALQERVDNLEKVLKQIKIFGPDNEGIVTLRWVSYPGESSPYHLPIAGWVRISADSLPGKELLKWDAKRRSALREDEP